MLFKRKHEFRPDRERSAGLLNKLYITKKQRLSLAKWLLMGLVLVVLSVLQDSVLSQVRLFGTTTDLVSAAIFLVCILLDPEKGCVFTLVSALCYEFSGSAPGAWAVALITVYGVLVSIFRHSLLNDGFGSTLLCTAGAILLYQVSVFCIGLFLGYTTASRLPGFLVTGLLSLAVMPLLYPIFSAISNIGGQTWRE